MTKFIPTAVLVLLFSGCLGGCASGDPEARATNVATNMQALKDAKFVGSVNIKSGGSPLGVGSLTHLWVGPRDTLWDASGRVNFSDQPSSEDAQSLMLQQILFLLSTRENVARPAPE